MELEEEKKDNQKFQVYICGMLPIDEEEELKNIYD